MPAVPDRGGASRGTGWRLLRARVLGRILGWLLWVWSKTLRLEVRGIEEARRWPGSPLAVWHGRIHGSLGILRYGGRLGAMFSASIDGELAVSALVPFNVRAARGSTGKGGRRALEELLRMTREGEIDMPVLTVDGPRGPARRVKPGIVELARKLDRPVLPVSFSASSAWVLRSWDRTVLAKPFSKVVAEVGPAIPLDPDETVAHATERIGRILDELTDRLDQEVHGGPLWDEEERKEHP